MALSLTRMIEGQLVTTTVTAARPSAASDGVDVTSWRWSNLGAFAPRRAVLFLDGSQAQTLASPTGGSEGPEVWGQVLGQWWRAGVVNNGASVEIAGASQGAALEIVVMGVFERLAIAGTPSAGTCVAKLAPIEEMQIQ